MRRISGTHPANIKNRSSKDLSIMMTYKNVYRSMSNEMLNRLDNIQAKKELTRRTKKAEKKSSKNA
jgi:phage replication-related protein YjqB (UPF0714/DUF867 family)